MGRSPKHKTIRIKQTRLPSSVVLVPRGISLSRTSQVKPYGPTYGYSSYRVLSPAAYVGLFIVLLFLLFIYLGYYCITRMEEDEIEIEYDAESENTAPIAVTSVTHTGMSQSGVTQIPAHTYQPTVYAAPYPAQTTGNTTVQMPMPMPAAQPPMPGMQPYVTPYPPMPQPGVASMAPPSYDAAMANPTPSYEKQMPYNPNFAQ